MSELFLYRPTEFEKRIERILGETAGPSLQLGEPVFSASEGSVSRVLRRGRGEIDKDGIYYSRTLDEDLYLISDNNTGDLEENLNKLNPVLLTQLFSDPLCYDETAMIRLENIVSKNLQSIYMIVLDHSDSEISMTYEGDTPPPKEISRYYPESLMGDSIPLNERNMNLAFKCFSDSLRYILSR